jgi:hypothetical protein
MSSGKAGGREPRPADRVPAREDGGAPGPVPLPALAPASAPAPITPRRVDHPQLIHIFRRVYYQVHRVADGAAVLRKLGGWRNPGQGDIAGLARCVKRKMMAQQDALH